MCIRDRIKGKDVITDPKTPKSNRVIQMPAFLCEEMRDYIKSLYGVKPTDRIFTVTKSYLHREMDRGAKEAGVKPVSYTHLEIHSTPRAVARLFTRQGCKAELIEATELYLEGVKAEEVNGQHITVGRGCVIERLDCNGTLHIEGNAVIHQITGSYTNV